MQLSADAVKFPDDVAQQDEPSQVVRLGKKRWETGWALPAGVIATRSSIIAGCRCHWHSRDSINRRRWRRRRRIGHGRGWCCIAKGGSGQSPDCQPTNNGSGNSSAISTPVPAAGATAPVATRRRRRMPARATAPIGARMRLGCRNACQRSASNNGQSKKKFCHTAHDVCLLKTGRERRTTPLLCFQIMRSLMAI